LDESTEQKYLLDSPTGNPLLAPEANIGQRQLQPQDNIYTSSKEEWECEFKNSYHINAKL